MSAPDDRFAHELDADAPMAWRPEEGEKLVGKVLSIVERISSYDGVTPYPLLEVLDEASGKVLQVHVFHEVLLGKLMEQQPKIGERVGIKYIRKGEKYHEYVFRVDRPDGSTAPVDWARYASDARDNPGQAIPATATQATTGDFAAPAPAREPQTDGAPAPVAAGLITPETYAQILQAFQAAGSPLAPLTAWLDATQGQSSAEIPARVAALRVEQGEHLLTWLRDR